MFLFWLTFHVLYDHICQFVFAWIKGTLLIVILLDGLLFYWMKKNVTCDDNLVKVLHWLAKRIGSISDQIKRLKAHYSLLFYWMDCYFTGWKKNVTCDDNLVKVLHWLAKRIGSISDQIKRFLYVQIAHCLFQFDWWSPVECLLKWSAFLSFVI